MSGRVGKGYKRLRYKPLDSTEPNELIYSEISCSHETLCFVSTEFPNGQYSSPFHPGHTFKIYFNGKPFYALTRLACIGNMRECNFQWHTCITEKEERSQCISIPFMGHGTFQSALLQNLLHLPCIFVWLKQQEELRTCDRRQPQPMWANEQQDRECGVQKRLLPAVQPQHRVPAPIHRTVLVPA